MQLGCCTWSFHNSFDAGMTLFDFMELCAKDLKVWGYEITDGHMKNFENDYINEVKRRSVELGLTITGLTVSNDFGRTGKEALDAELELVERMVRASAALGAPVLRVFAGWPDTDREAQWDTMVEYMKKSCETAAEHGVVLAVENHNHGGFLQTSADVERILDDTGSPWLGFNLDTGNYLDGMESMERTAGRSAHVHAKMNEVAPDGSEPNIDYPGVAALLRAANYRGFVCLEYEGEEDELPAVRRGTEYLKKLIGVK